uniref:Uncharacterized protein n=1 Tax=Anopheles atroparvus TaxID=41427 RepID=A0A182ISG9_ANOAO
MASVAGQEQTQQASNQVSGFPFELLLTHLSAIEGRIQERLNELGRNQTRQLELLRIVLTHGNHENIPYRVEVIENMSDGRLNGEWIVLQTRFDGSLSFSRDWREYVQGFGDFGGEHWLGLEKQHRLLAGKRHELLVVLETFENETAYANYDDFRIGNESQRYVMSSLGNYSGTAGDSLMFHLGSKFSTQDQDNDSHSANCAAMYHGGWWYKNCYASNLNGKYSTGNRFKEVGIIWHSFKGPFNSMKTTKMLIRPYKGMT